MKHETRLIRPPALLAVFAHPDDEVYRPGGTLALLARRGLRVHVLAATRGEAGSCGDPPLCQADELAAVRERELRCACAALGIQPPRLLDYGDGTLADVNEEVAVTRVMAAVEEFSPQILLTWPPDGLSGHPDHVAVSRWTTLVFQRAEVWGPDAPVALYHVVLPCSVAQSLGMSHLHTVPDGQVTLAVDVTPVWEEKLAAIRCHRTQMGASPILQAPLEKQQLFLGREYFRLALRRPALTARAEGDLLESLRET